MYCFALIDTETCELVFWRRFLEAIRICLEIAGQLLHLRFIGYGGFKVYFQLIHLDTDPGHCVGGLLLVWHIAYSVRLTIYIALYLG